MRCGSIRELTRFRTLVGMCDGVICGNNVLAENVVDGTTRSLCFRQPWSRIASVRQMQLRGPSGS